MTTSVTVKELASYLLDLIDKGHGSKTVELSVHYDNCHHIQPLGEVYVNDYELIDWITLIGVKE